MQDTLALQKELLASLEFQNRQISLKFDKGLVSEYDKFVADINLAKQKLGIAKLERSLENAKMSLKQLTGNPLDHEVSLVPYDAVSPPGKPDSYEKYLESPEQQSGSHNRQARLTGETERARYNEAIYKG